MTEEQKLSFLKQDLQLLTGSFDEYLKYLLNVAREAIAREGIRLTDSYEDTNLQVMYARWLYSKRDNRDNGMPRMLRFALNNRCIGQVAGGAEDVT